MLNKHNMVVKHHKVESNKEQFYSNSLLCLYSLDANNDKDAVMPSKVCKKKKKPKRANCSFFNYWYSNTQVEWKSLLYYFKSSFQDWYICRSSLQVDSDMFIKTQTKNYIYKKKKLQVLSMNTAAPDKEAFWDNVWDDKEATHERYYEAGVCTTLAGRPVLCGHKILCRGTIWKEFKDPLKSK